MGSFCFWLTQFSRHFSKSPLRVYYKLLCQMKMVIDETDELIHGFEEFSAFNNFE